MTCDKYEHFSSLLQILSMKLIGDEPIPSSSKQHQPAIKTEPKNCMPSPSETASSNNSLLVNLLKKEGGEMPGEHPPEKKRRKMSSLSPGGGRPSASSGLPSSSSSQRASCPSLAGLAERLQAEAQAEQAQLLAAQQALLLSQQQQQLQQGSHKAHKSSSSPHSSASPSSLEYSRTLNQFNTRIHSVASSSQQPESKHLMGPPAAKTPASIAGGSGGSSHTYHSKQRDMFNSSTNQQLQVGQEMTIFPFS